MQVPEIRQCGECRYWSGRCRKEKGFKMPSDIACDEGKPRGFQQ